MSKDEKYEIRFKELAEEEKPRERLIRFGPGILKNSELLAIILNTGYKGESVTELSARIIKEYGTKGILFERNVARMMEAAGLGKVKACQVIATVELGRRLFEEEPGRMPVLKKPEDVYRHVEDMKKLKKEEFRGLYLNTRNKVIHDEVLSIGTLTANLVHPREVFQPAIEYSAAGMILAHNHPSGDPMPSDDDIRITKRLVEVGKLIEIELLDHLIIGNGSYTSLREEGKM